MNVRISLSEVDYTDPAQIVRFPFIGKYTANMTPELEAEVGRRMYALRKQARAVSEARPVMFEEDDETAALIKRMLANASPIKEILNHLHWGNVRFERFCRKIGAELPTRDTRNERMIARYRSILSIIDARGDYESIAQLERETGFSKGAITNAIKWRGKGGK